MKVKRVLRVYFMVKDIDKACAVLGDLFETKFNPPTESREQGVKASYAPIGIELVSPLSPDSVHARTLAKRGEGLTMVALAVDDLEKATAEVEKRGIRIVNKVFSPDGTHMETILHPKDVFGVMVTLFDHRYVPGSVSE